MNSSMNAWSLVVNDVSVVAWAVVGVALLCLLLASSAALNIREEAASGDTFCAFRGCVLGGKAAFGALFS